MPAETTFRESTRWATPIRDLGLQIRGTRLEPILARFEVELARAGITRLRPRVYLSTEWGVPFETVAIAVPFYLADPELTALHAERVGHVEGLNRADILRYLRHEMGHVVNYAYRLYDRAEWVERFGPITRPYEERYRPEPFSRRHVLHLPGWYAQKHPDEDWAETFAVWMTPGLDWRAEYALWPDALAKLEYCDRVMVELREQDPLVTEAELDEDVGEIEYSIGQFYEGMVHESEELPPGLDGALRAIFHDLAEGEAEGETMRPAQDLIRRNERELVANIFRWTGHFPEPTRRLLRQLTARAAQLELGYPEQREHDALVALTTFISALAMNYVHRGRYMA